MNAEIDLNELLPDALHRPAPEGVRVVALWWLVQLENAGERTHEAHHAVSCLVSTLRENRELLTDAAVKTGLRELRSLQRLLNDVHETDSQRAWLEAEREMLLPDASAEAEHLAHSLEAVATKQCRAATKALRKHAEKGHDALERALSRFTIHGTVGVPLNLDSWSAHSAGRLNRHVAKLVRALHDVEGLNSKRELKRVSESFRRIGALLFPFVAQLPALGALYQTASGALQHLSALNVATRLAKHARHEKLDGLAAVLEDVRLSHYNAFASEWLGDRAERAFASAYAATAALQISVDVTQLSEGRFTSEYGIPVEIERKYLLSGCPPEAAVVAGTRIEQGWIPGRTLRERLRRSTYPTGVSRYTRTVKFGRGISRVELEEDTDRHLFDALWPLTASARVRKRRHAIREGAHTWEIDVFTDRDLVLAEVELKSTDDIPTIPSWLEKWVVREVTGEAEYVNANLAIAEDDAAATMSAMAAAPANGATPHVSVNHG
jgi:adenylate cyclase